MHSETMIDAREKTELAKVIGFMELKLKD